MCSEKYFFHRMLLQLISLFKYFFLSKGDSYSLEREVHKLSYEEFTMKASRLCDHPVDRFPTWSTDFLMPLRWNVAIANLITNRLAILSCTCSARSRKFRVHVKNVRSCKVKVYGTGFRYPQSKQQVARWRVGGIRTFRQCLMCTTLFELCTP